MKARAQSTRKSRRGTVTLSASQRRAGKRSSGKSGQSSGQRQKSKGQQSMARQRTGRQSTRRQRTGQALPSAKRGSGAGQSRTGARSQKTQDHEEIREWVEARGGQPARVKGTERGNDREGVLRIDFPGFSGEGSLQPISWEEWFKVFDERGLVFLYQEKTANGKSSRFNKLVCP